VSTGGDDRERYAEDWFDEPIGGERGAFRDPDAETWLEEEPERYSGHGDRRQLVAAIAVAVVLILAGVGIARVLGGGDDDNAALPSLPGTTAATDTGATGPVETGTTATTTPAITVPEDATLQSGDEGDSVELLQQALDALGYDVGTPDGVFGPGTEEAVKAFQADSGLAADGIAGPTTLSALNDTLASAG
jgi:Putative peptidoglycan binding domain